MTARALFNPQAANYLVKLLGILGSDHAGEVAVAGRKANEFVRDLGLTWAICHPPDSWLQMAADCHQHERLLNERDFIDTISRMRRPFSGKQQRWLKDIHARVHEQDHAA